MSEMIEFSTHRSYSIIAMNLKTVKDIELVIRQCEAIKEQITSGYMKLSINPDGTIGLKY